MTVQTAYQYLYGGALIVFLILIGAMVIRSIIGPRSTDRIMSVNMLGTMTICAIAILSFLLHEGYLADVALIYAMISFVAVLMMASMFIPAKPGRPRLDKEGERGNSADTGEKTDQRDPGSPACSQSEEAAGRSAK
jgi:multicomponent Na+:H+ antiporter subunit F